MVLIYVAFYGFSRRLWPNGLLNNTKILYINWNIIIKVHFVYYIMIDLFNLFKMATTFNKNRFYVITAKYSF